MNIEDIEKNITFVRSRIVALQLSAHLLLQHEIDLLDEVLSGLKSEQLLRIKPFKSI